MHHSNYIARDSNNYWCANSLKYYKNLKRCVGMCHTVFYSLYILGSENKKVTKHWSMKWHNLELVVALLLEEYDKTNTMYKYYMKDALITKCILLHFDQS